MEGGLPQWGTLMGVPHLGYPPVRPRWGVPRWQVPHLGYPPPPPCQTWQGGTLAGGYPTSGTPTPSDLAGGYPQWGVPHLRYPLSDLVGGYPMGVPHLRYSPHQTWPWGYPHGRVPPQVVLDMPQSVYLLHSRRRTFLFEMILQQVFLQIKCKFKLNFVF